MSEITFPSLADMERQAPSAPSLDDLAVRLAAAKAAEDDARRARLDVEAEILRHPMIAAGLREEGTHKIGQFTIRTSFTRSWDQAKLAAVAPSINPAFWPFKAEYKEDRRASRVMEERFPDLWEKVRGALTLKPSKPAVSLKDAGE